MSQAPARLTVLELAPAADELWELPADPQSGYLHHADGVVGLPDVASGAKLRPRISAYYASGKATNVARVLDAFLRDEARTPLAMAARERLAARLVTFLPGQPGGYQRPAIPGAELARFTPGGAYLACLQARDFHAVELELQALPPTADVQADRRCANIVGAGGGELVNFSPYLYWEPACAEAVLGQVGASEVDAFVSLAGSLPLIDGAPQPGLYADVIAALKARNPRVLVSLDVGGAPLSACLERDALAHPGLICVNLDEYGDVPTGLWEGYAGIIAVHNKRGCWVLQGEAPPAAELARRAPDVAVPADVHVVHTICAGDAAHGGFVLGLMLFGTDPAGVRRAAVLSQACGLTVVESHDSIRGLTAAKVEGNIGRFGV